ncbi:MAG: zinc transporter ZntB [Hyphomicrobiaceae bacterium]
MSEDGGLICAYYIDEGGTSKLINWADLKQGVRTTGWTWVHLDRNGDGARDWLQNNADLEENTVEALLAEESRPRCIVRKTGTLLILRGVNLNPHANPEDMISVRVWIENNRIITVRRRKLMAMDQIRQNFNEGTGPISPGEFVLSLTSGLVERMEGVMDTFEGEIDELETEQLTGSVSELRNNLVTVRQRMIPLRRYLAPQRDALAHLLVAKTEWMDDWHRSRLYDVADQVTRFVEDLDSARERTSVIQDSMTNRIAERMNQIMMLLSIVAAVFLPLGFVTGLLGINVGGIPGAENSSAFGIVTGLLITVALLELAIFKWLKWI